MNGGVDSNNMMTSIPDHGAVRGETKIEPQVTQTNLQPITGATMPLYSGAVQPGMETGGFTTPLREHRFGNSVWQPAAAPPDPNGSWASQGQFIQQIPPPQIEEIRYPQYAVTGYPQATPVVGYQQNTFMQTNGNLYNGTPQPQPSPHSMHNGNARTTPTLNGNMEYVEQSPRPSEYMNGSYPHSNQPEVMAPPTSSTPTSRCGSAQLENGEGKYTNPPTPTTPSNQGNAMPGYPLQIPPQSVQSSRNSSGYPGQVNDTTDCGKGENKHNNTKDREVWNSSPRPSEMIREDIRQYDNHQMHKNGEDSWSDGRNTSNNQGNAQNVWSSSANEVSTTQHQDTWPASPQTKSSMAQQKQKLQERYQQHQMNQAQMQHPQNSPQMKEESQQSHHSQPSPQMHQTPTPTQSHMYMQQHSPHVQQQQASIHHQQSQQQQMHQSNHQEQQQLAQMRHHQQQQRQKQHQQQQQQQQNSRQLALQLQQTHMSMHQQQLPSPIHQQNPHMQQQNLQNLHGNQQNQLTSIDHQMMGPHSSSPHHREMWPGQPNSRPPSQNPPEPWPNESQQQMWANDKKSSSQQFNERAELNNRLKTMILNKQQQEMKKIQEGGNVIYTEQKNAPPVSSGNFLAQGHHPRKLVSEGGGFRSRGSYDGDGLNAMENIVNSVTCYDLGHATPVSSSESFLQRMASSKYYQVSSQTSQTQVSQVTSSMKTGRRTPLSPPHKIKQEPIWEEKSPWAPTADAKSTGFSSQNSHTLPNMTNQHVKTEKDPGGCDHPFSPEGGKLPVPIKTENFEADQSNEYLFDEGDIKTEDIKLSPEQIENLERLKSTAVDAPGCECFPPDHIPSEPGPYYTHLGYAKSLEELRENVEKRTGFSGKAIRIEKVVFTGKEGKTTSGCPLGKWIIRRSGPDEKVLMIVKNRKGHVCATSWIVIVTVAWEGVPSHMADDLYETVTDKLKNYGVVTSRRCGVNEPRTCACQGLDNTTCGASFSFGCSWSMYYNGCKFARSKTARKFKLSVRNEEQCIEDRLQNLATFLAPLYKTMAPDSYSNMTQHEVEAGDCRLGLEPGRPWSGVTACFDFCAHAHRDIHNMNNGCTTVVTLTKHRSFEKPDDEQLHVLPLYVIDESDEFGSKEAQEGKIKSGAIEVLSKFPFEVRTRQSPLESCRKMAKKRKDEREHAKRALAYKMSLSLDCSPDSPHQNNHPVQNGLSNNVQRNFLQYPSTPDKGQRGREALFYNHPADFVRSSFEESHSPQRAPSCPSSPFRSPLSVLTHSPGSVFGYSAPSTPDTPKHDRSFSPLASPNTVFRRPVGRPLSRSSNPATPQPNLDSTYLKPQDRVQQEFYGQVSEPERSVFQPYSPQHSPVMQPYSPFREQVPSLPPMPNFTSPLRDGFISKPPAFSFSRSYESSPAPASTMAMPLRPKSTYSISGMSPLSPGLKCSSVSTQCSPSKSPYSVPQQYPSPCHSSSSGYWSNGSSSDRDSVTPNTPSGYCPSPPKWSPRSRHSGLLSPPAQSSYTSPSTPTSLTSQPSPLPSFQNLRKTPDPAQYPWNDHAYSGVTTFSQNQTWSVGGRSSYCNQPSPGLYQQERPMSNESYHRQQSPVSQPQLPESPSKQWAPPWNSNTPALPRTPDVEPHNLLGSVTDFVNNEECFIDPSVGGVAIALSHGAVLFEVAKHELHATTALRQPNRFQPTRISLVFYQHRNLNKPDHGRGEWNEKQRCKKELAEKQQVTTSEIATQSTDDPESQSVGTMMDPMPYSNYYPMSTPSPIRYSPVVQSPSPHAHLNPPTQMPGVPSPSFRRNLFPLHPSVVQGPYQESETLG